MKTLQILLSFLLITIATTAFAQAKTETFAVSGECKTCKKKIEAAAKEAGATYAVWNVDSKKLTVKYNSDAATTESIQQHIAGAGYDTPLAKASDSAYNRLDECCQYPRASQTTKAADKAACCAKDAACCKDGSTCCAKQ